MTIFCAGGDVMYSHSRQKTQQTSNKQYLFADSTSYENAFSNAIDRSHNLTGNFRMQWQVDSLNTLDFRPSFMLSVNDSDKASGAACLQATPTAPRSTAPTTC